MEANKMPVEMRSVAEDFDALMKGRHVDTITAAILVLATEVRYCSAFLGDIAGSLENLETCAYALQPLGRERVGQ